MWGVGPQDSGYSLGGEMYWAAGLHLYHPLPFIYGQINRFLKLHAFLTTGKLFNYDTGDASKKHYILRNKSRDIIGYVSFDYCIALTEKV